MKLPVVDAHADIFSKCIEDGLDYLDDAGRFQASLALLSDGGVRLQWASIYVPAAFSGDDATNEALRIVGAAHGAVARLEERSRLVTTRRALREIDWEAGEPRTDFLLSMEGASPLVGNVERLDLFARLGMRVLGLTHNHANECGDGCFARKPEGLTDAGRTIAREAEARGILLDAAHLNPVAFDQVMTLARGPVIYSHGGSRELLDAPRNLTDAQAKAIAASGGVLGVDFYPGHVAKDGKRGTIDDVVAHVEHWAEVVGAAHVGFGGDFDGIPTTLSGVETAAVYPALLDRLAARGFSGKDLEQIAWKNWVRVLERRLGETPAGDRVSVPREPGP